MPAPSVGRVVHVLVHPDDHGGADHAPALISRVHDDGTVNVRAFPDSDKVLRLEGLAVYDDRAAAEAFLDEHRQLLPPGTDRDGSGKVIPHPPYHVTRWVSAAYWPPADTEPADTEPAGEEPKKTPAKKTAGKSESES